MRPIRRPDVGHIHTQVARNGCDRDEDDQHDGQNEESAVFSIANLAYFTLLDRAEFADLRIYISRKISSAAGSDDFGGIEMV